MPTGLRRLLRLVSFEPTHAVLPDIAGDALHIPVFVESAQLLFLGEAPEFLIFVQSPKLVVLGKPAELLVFIKTPEVFVLVQASQLIVIRKTLHLVHGAIGRLVQSAESVIACNSGLSAE